MDMIEVARRMASLGQRGEALRAYMLVLDADSEPLELMEAAVYLLHNGGDYKVSFTVFIQLYNAGCFRQELLPLMKKAFYEPNSKMLKKRYERNCKMLGKYPYLFRNDFPPFEELPLVFFPYDGQNAYVPYSAAQDAFTGYVNVRDPVITRHFFKNLEKPILAEDVFSQYELEYLRDNVRPSEWVSRENHIYLHYSDWAEFCAWLQVLSLRSLLESKKFVFLIGDEIAQYPIDFKERFGIDYSSYPLRPVGIREIKKMIWHTQLSAHNGGDFFNEICDGHPNLLYLSSVLFDGVHDTVRELRKAMDDVNTLEEMRYVFQDWKTPALVDEMYQIRNLTDSELMVAYFLREDTRRPENQRMDPASRIVPALFFQPHFYNIHYDIGRSEKGDAILISPEADRVRSSSLFKGFPYIKTFTPIRLPTMSCGGTANFMWNRCMESDALARTETESAQKEGNYVPGGKKTAVIMSDVVLETILNRSFMRNPDDRIYHDSVIVRYEDGKLNPKATFTALTEFLDIPYTESMTYCSIDGNRDPYGMGDSYQRGFFLAPEDRYDNYLGDTEKRFIETYMRDVYAFYGYRFRYYDGQPVDEDAAAAAYQELPVIDARIVGTMREAWLAEPKEVGLTKEQMEGRAELSAAVFMEANKERRVRAIRILSKRMYFVNERRQPLQMTPMLELDPELLEREVYQ